MNLKCFNPSLIVLFSITFFSANAQSYRFESTSGTYSELSGAKQISFTRMTALSGLYRLSELDGEVFKWYNTLFPLDTIKTFHIQDYANLRFDNDSSLIIVDGAFTYLDSIDATSSISYTIEGGPGNRLVKAQWKNLKARVGKAGNFVNVQIWVYQRSGVYEIHYGPSSANNQSGFNQTSGPQVGIFYSLDDFTKCFEKLWVIGAPASLKLDSNANYSFRAMSGIPVEGVVLRFIPRFKTLGIMNSAPEHDNINVYPNPVSGGMLNFSQAGDYRLYDVYGREVLAGMNVSGLDVSSLPDGIYSVVSNLPDPLKIVIRNR
jgi:hypothetical protein